MSDAVFNQNSSSWKDLVLVDDKMECLNKNADVVLAITYCAQNTNQNMVLDYLKEEPQTVLLSPEQVTCIIRFVASRTRSFGRHRIKF